MERVKILSGEELVARGTTKTDASLPEIGLKDVLPNGSWLEQKQIQSALEARKHLIEVERIEKCGVLSHAEWREELMLAEVTQNAGSHWQFLGHSMGKKLYLKPEEALFLMEVNCLRLKHNEVAVSLQQAYSMLLRGKMLLLQYRVYASLSRLGYKVYRHEIQKQTEYGKKMNLPPCSKRSVEENNVIERDEEVSEDIETVPMVNADLCDKDVEMSTVCDPENNACSSSNTENIVENTTSNSDINEDKAQSEPVSSTENYVTIAQKFSQQRAAMETEIIEIAECASDNIILDNTIDASESHPTETQPTTSENVPQFTNSNENINSIPETFACQNKLKMLLNRKLKPSNASTVEKCFGNVPELSQNAIVTVAVPEEQYLPRNVFLNNTKYELNLETIRAKTRNNRSISSESRYSSNEEANGEHVRRIRDLVTNNRVGINWEPPNPTIRFADFRAHNDWRPQQVFFPYNIIFQRPFVPVNIVPRFFPRPPPLLRICPRGPNIQLNVDSRNMPNYLRKRRRNSSKETHLLSIKILAVKLKQLIMNGNTQTGNVESLHRLIDTFNVRYNSRIRLSEDYEVFTDDDRIVETISLDDEEATNSKRSRVDHSSQQTENFNELKALASKLKALETNHKSNSRLRRAFSHLLKKYNKSYNMDIYLDSNFEIIDKRFIKLDSSSDSDCVVEETPKKVTGKKLKNPFSILKQLSQKQKPCTSRSNVNDQGGCEDEVKVNKYTEELKQVFGKHWLPDDEDFGRAEVFPLNLMNPFLIESKREEYIFEFIKSQPYSFENWLEIKIAFLNNVAESSAMMQTRAAESNNNPDSIASIINPNDCTDTASVLSKLSIIKTNKEVDTESTLAVDFDVYNRGVKNFKKSSRPEPHFRIVCIEETSPLPSGKQIATLHSKYDDNISVLFAVVGPASISYLQMNPHDLPIYIPSNDLT